MMTGQTIHIKAGTVGLVAYLLLLAVGLLFRFVRASGNHSAIFHGHSHAAADWSVPAVDADGGGESFFHQWDPRLKIVSLFIYSFLVVSLHQLVWCLFPPVIGLLAIKASKLPWRRGLLRLAAMSGFLSMFLLLLPFTMPQQPGETLIVFDPFPAWPFHVAGFWLALKIVCKAVAVALIMEPLLGTAPFGITLQAMEKLGAPAAVCQMILLSYRYVFVLLDEMKRMYRSMRVRGFRPGTNLETMQATGNFLGMLFVRSFDRTQRVYDAMLSRGYRGSFPTFTKFEATTADWAKAGLWVGMGVALLALDRLV